MKINFQNFEYKKDSKIISLIIFKLSSSFKLRLNDESLSDLIQLYNSKPTWEQIAQYILNKHNVDISNISKDAQQVLTPSPMSLNFESFQYGYQGKEKEYNLNFYATKYGLDKIFTPLQIRDMSIIYPDYYKEAYNETSIEKHEQIFTKHLHKYLHVMKDETNYPQIKAKIYELCIQMNTLSKEEIDYLKWKANR